MPTVLEPQKTEVERETHRIDHFFSMPAARADRWRELTAVARSWSDGRGDLASVASALEAIEALEEFHAFPGAHLMALLRDRLDEASAASFAELARGISTAIVTRSYKHARKSAADDDQAGGRKATDRDRSGARLGDARPRGGPASLFRNAGGRPECRDDGLSDRQGVPPAAPTRRTSSSTRSCPSARSRTRSAPP